MFLVEEDRYIYSANVVCANQNIKKSGYSSLKQNPFEQKRKTNLLESHCRTKIPRRNKIARTTRKAGRCDKISCNGYARRALSGVSLWKKALPGVEKTTLFLLQLGDDGNPKKDADEPVWGYFLQQRQTKKYRAGRRVFVPQSRKRENNSADKERHTGGAVFRPPCVKIYTHSQLLEQRKTSPQLPTASIGPYGHFSHSDAFSVGTLARIARPRPKFSSAKFCKVAQSSTNCFE